MNIKTALQRVAEGHRLSAQESETLFDSIFSGSVSEVELAALLVALRMRRESADELIGAARSMRRFAVKPELGTGPFFDTCGTGGDHSGSFNISTSVAIILSAMGVPVAKHGNRSVSSKSGSADFLEALGVPITLQGYAASSYFAKNNFLFLFAQLHHPAMKHAAPVRKALGMRTIFNYLGPLTNPATPGRQAIGVFHPDVLPLYAETASKLGFERVLLYSGEGGMDEVSPARPTIVYDVRGTSTGTFTISPDEFITGAEARQLPSNCSPAGNVALFMDTISAKEPTPLGKCLALNTALAMQAANGHPDMRRNYRTALDCIHGGDVLKKVNALREEAA
jgi:anthranilate phosphoribosyltransferase